MNRFTRTLLLTLLMGLAGSANAVVISLQPGPEGKDAQLISGPLADSNRGNSQYLVENWSGNLRSAGLLEFDLSSLGVGTVNSASLDIYHILNFNEGSTYNIYRVTSAWDEATVTLNTAPTYDAAAVASLTFVDGAPQQYRTWDVTSLVAGWLSGAFANYGLWIEEAVLQGSATAYLNSSDADQAFRPRLNIDYTPGVTGVPEPTMLALFGLGLAMFGFARRKNRA